MRFRNGQHATNRVEEGRNLLEVLRGDEPALGQRGNSRTYQCRCGPPIFFANTQCLNCNSPLGFLPDTQMLVALDPGDEPGTVRPDGRTGLYRYCGNRDTPALCNWLIAPGDDNPLCIACRLNNTIPNLDDPDNARYWGAIEAAKRRLVAQLLALGLPVKSKVDEIPSAA